MSGFASAYRRRHQLIGAGSRGVPTSQGDAEDVVPDVWLRLVEADTHDRDMDGPRWREHRGALDALRSARSATAARPFLTLWIVTSSQRTNPLVLGASALLASALVRVALPVSLNPENPLQTLGEFVAEVALWFGLLTVAASLLLLVLSEAMTTQPWAAIPPIPSSHLLSAALGLLVASLALRLVFFRMRLPDEPGRIDLLAGHVQFTVLALGLFCLVALALRKALHEAAPEASGPR